MYTITPFAYWILIVFCAVIFIIDLITQNWTGVIIMVVAYIFGRIVGRL